LLISRAKASLFSALIAAAVPQRAGIPEGSFRALALELQGGGAVPRDVVQFDDAILDGAVQPLQAIFGIAG
jgi:hypothetical protein